MARVVDARATAASRSISPRCLAIARRELPADTIVCNGAGNFSGWWHRYWPYAGYPSQLAPTAGAMGYGVPAAVAAALRFPDRCVVAVAGDGDFLMNGQELATAAQHGCDLLVIVVDNGSYGTIRMHQERTYPGRVAATDLANPDFAALGAAFGAWSRAGRDHRGIRRGAGRGEGAQRRAPAPLPDRHRAAQRRRRDGQRAARQGLNRKGPPSRTALSNARSRLRSCRRARP